jgi:hypothetical protein
LFELGIDKDQQTLEFEVIQRLQEFAKRLMLPKIVPALRISYLKQNVKPGRRIDTIGLSN